MNIFIAERQKKVDPVLSPFDTFTMHEKNKLENSLKEYIII